MEYGSMRIEVPFAVKCRDFQLDKYPGSNTPSSFASEVTIIDDEKKYTRDQRIFMNNVMDYRGYRFFQSSYDPDEKGTRLSVNHDFWGTLISYIGYLFMAIGMILSLFAPAGRFRHLNSLLKKSREKREKLISVFIAVLMLTSFSFGQTGHEGHNHAEPTRPEGACIEANARHPGETKDDDDVTMPKASTRYHVLGANREAKKKNRVDTCMYTSTCIYIYEGILSKSLHLAARKILDPKLNVWP